MAVLATAGLLACLAPVSASAGADPVLGRGLELIERAYLFHDQVHAGPLLEAALEAAQRRFESVRVEEVGAGAFVLEGPGCRERLEAPPSQDLRDLQAPLEQARSFLDTCVPDRDEDLPSSALVLIDGVLDALDPYSTVLEGNRQTEHHIQFTGKLAGIGARIGIREGDLTLIQVYEGAPAFRAGLRDGDLVRRIDGLSTTNISVLDAVQHIRGRAGTDVVLTVERPGSDQLDEVRVTRGLVRIPSVRAEILGNDIIHAEITHYSQTTPEDFRSRVGTLLGRYDIKGIVIDVRRNSGGSMLGSAAIADLFLNSGVLITTAGRDGKAVRGLSNEIDATFDTPFGSLPLAVLTSKTTASGSELMAASLRNHDRAILVGQRSFGKGTVQKTFPLGDGAVAKLTIGRFLPNRRVIPGGGLVPDVEVLPYTFSERGVGLPDRQPKELPYWLQTPDWAEPDRSEPLVRIFSVRHSGAAIAPPDSQKSHQPKEREDTALEVAAMILRRFPSTSASRMLDFARVILKEKVDEADALLAREIDDHGVDWTAGPRANGPAKFSVSMSDSGPLEAGAKGDVVFRLRNEGSAPAYRVRAMLDSSAPVLQRRGLLFGKIEPGESRVASIRVEPSRRTRTGRMETRLQLFDDQGPLATLGPVFLAVEHTDRPEIRFRRRVQASSDGTMLKVTVEIENQGRADAQDLRVLLTHDLEGRFELLDGASTIEELEPGGTRTLSFRVRMLGSFAEPEHTELTLAAPDAGLLLESDLALVPTEGFGSWAQAPRISFATLEPTASEGVFSISAVVSDDSGLRSVLARIDGKRVERLEAGEADARELRMTLPWRPTEGVKLYEVSAVDSDGLRTLYTAGL